MVFLKGIWSYHVLFLKGIRGYNVVFVRGIWSSHSGISDDASPLGMLDPKL